MSSTVVSNSAHVRVLALGVGLVLGAIAVSPEPACAQAVVRGTLPGHKG